MLPRSISLPLRSVLLLVLLATYATAGPVYARSHAQQQQILKSDGLIMPSKQQRLHTSQFLDARPNSIGILLTTAGGEEEEVLHLWLPIGERVYTRDNPVLPLHPLTVRVTTMIASAPERASVEYLASIECRIFPGFGGPMQLVDRTSSLPTEFAARSFYKGDGVVQVGSVFGVDGWEVEAYECS